MRKSFVILSIVLLLVGSVDAQRSSSSSSSSSRSYSSSSSYSRPSTNSYSSSSYSRPTSTPSYTKPSYSPSVPQKIGSGNTSTMRTQLVAPPKTNTVPAKSSVTSTSIVKTSPTPKTVIVPNKSVITTLDTKKVQPKETLSTSTTSKPVSIYRSKTRTSKYPYKYNGYYYPKPYEYYVNNHQVNSLSTAIIVGEIVDEIGDIAEESVPVSNTPLNQKQTETNYNDYLGLVAICVFMSILVSLIVFLTLRAIGPNKK